MIRFVSFFDAPSFPCDILKYNICFFIFIYIVSLMKGARMAVGEPFDKLYRKFCFIKYLIVDRTYNCQMKPGQLAFKLRPQDARSIKKLDILIEPDPLFSFCHTGFVPRLGTGSSAQ